jgi:hypothetical protein
MKLKCVLMALTLVWASAVFSEAYAGGNDRRAEKPEPVVGQVHVISVHVADHECFDAVFLFLRDVLRLPLVYGTLSKPNNPQERLYAGFSVGNAYLEPCGPYPSDAPFSADRPARFHGLTFSPATTLSAGEGELNRRKIEHSGIYGSGTMPKFLYISDASLTGKLLAVSLWEVLDKQDRVNLGFLSSSLQQAKGGTLGVRCIEEVRIGFPDKDDLEAWHNFLKPARREGSVWHVGNGPALRFIPADEARIDSIVLKVGSLAKAKSALHQQNPVGKQTPDGLEVDVTKACGLRIVLKE